MTKQLQRSQVSLTPLNLKARNEKEYDEQDTAWQILKFFRAFKFGADSTNS